jgi:hypothetical protein
MIQLAHPLGAAAPRPTPEDSDRLADEIAELAAHLHAATYRLLVLLREYDVREARGWGFRSCAHWLSWRTGIAPGAAREKVRVARALDALPLISAAMERGELSYSKVRALTRGATAENEASLLEFARCGTASHVERLVRAWRRVDRQEEAEEERLRHDRRYLSLHPDEDGGWALRARLDPEVGALLEQALAWASEQLYGKRPSPETSQGQRRADALGLVAEQALAAAGAAPDRGRSRSRMARRADRFQVVLHVERSALEGEPAEVAVEAEPVVEKRPVRPSADGQAVLAASGQRVPAGTARRLACDASVVEMTHGADGNVLDVGRRRRTVPAAIRRALEHRDETCRFPGCGSRYCDVHHVEHWADGGRTKLSNLSLLCRVHHRAVHEGGFRVEIDDAGVVRFRTPWGWLMPAVPAPPPVRAADGGAGDAPATLRGDHERAGLEIDGWTPTPDWHGERLDLDWAIYMLRRRRDGA